MLSVHAAHHIFIGSVWHFQHLKEKAQIGRRIEETVAAQSRQVKGQRFFIAQRPVGSAKSIIFRGGQAADFWIMMVDCTFAMAIQNLPEDRRLIVGGLDKFRSEEHTSALQSLMRISYAVFFLNKKKKQ